eukprot:2280303-Pyramimonas_sp.AAC.1
MVHAPASRPLVTNRDRTRWTPAPHPHTSIQGRVALYHTMRRCVSLPAGLQTRRRTCELAAVTPRPGVNKSQHGQLVQLTVRCVAQAAARTPEKKKTKSCQRASSLPV